MYQPPHHREDDLGTQHELIRSHPLGLLITAGNGGPIANLVPFHLKTGLSSKGTLQAHIARANGQWREIQAGAPVLVVFQGAESYITPSWYATKQETGKVVPTWNYVVVQVRGNARVIEDHAWLREQIGMLTGENESGRLEPWTVGDAPPDFIAAQLKGIIGIEIDIETIDGKWKVSQNRPAADRQGVAHGLDGIDRDSAAEMAELVRRYDKQKQD